MDGQRRLTAESEGLVGSVFGGQGENLLEGISGHKGAGTETEARGALSRARSPSQRQQIS